MLSHRHDSVTVIFILRDTRSNRTGNTILDLTIVRQIGVPIRR